MMVSGIRVAAVSTLLFGLFTAAQAQTTAYSFEVDWTTGELAGTSSAGTLSFANALAIPNAQYFQPNALSSFGFTLRGSFYDLSAVETGFLTFDADGQLRLLGVGTNCNPGSCSSVPGDINSFYLVYDSQSGLDKFYGVAGDSGYATSYGPGTLQVSPVPEPSTVALLTAGLVLGGLSIRRRG